MSAEKMAVGARMGGWGHEPVGAEGAAVRGRVVDSHGAADSHAPTGTKGSAVPVSAAEGRGPTGAKGRVVGAGAAESRGPTGAEGAVIEAKKAPRGRKIRRPTGAEDTANSVGRGGGTTG